MKARYQRGLSLLNSLASESPELPFDPRLLPQLFAAVAEDSTTGVDHIAALVERSQWLASRILRLANSAYYGMPSAVSSLSLAVRFLGIKEVRNLTLQLGMSSVFDRLALPKSFPAKQFLDHQLLTASLARTMVQCLEGHESDLPDPETMYAMGLLHDLGKTIMASRCPYDWLDITRLAEEEGLALYQAEEQYWGIDHAVVGSRLLTFWDLPQDLYEPVSWHHAPERADEEHRLAAGLLSAANILAHEDTAEHGPDPQTVSSLIAEQLPDLDPAGVSRILEAFDTSQAHILWQAFQAA